MADIQHFVVLMLENRSFDTVLGRLVTPAAGFNGLPHDAANVWSGHTYYARDPIDTRQPFTVPTPDPGEKFVDISQQIFGSSPVADMSGFAVNYTRQPTDGNRANDPQAVMYSYMPEQLPVLHTLARAFAVSDQWFASAPCQTWPNRFFAHTGTCNGVVDNSDFARRGQLPFPAPSIFRALEDASVPWRVYFHDLPQSILLADALPLAPLRFRPFAQFLADAGTGHLPAYSFIEPHYFANIVTGTPPNDQHPPHDVQFAERLVYDVYTALRASPAWNRTLLLITYDEHGGCYDHVPPPRAAPPDEAMRNPYNFIFDRFGVRVPAIVVSPWVSPGSLLQPLADGPVPFDHTSIIRTVRDLFDISGAFGKRELAAPSLKRYLDLPRPTNPGPPELPKPTVTADRTLLQQIGNAAVNDFQSALGAAIEGLDTGLSTIGRAAEDAAESAARVVTRAVAQIEALLG